MSAKQVAASSTPGTGGTRGSVLIAMGFPLFCAAYLAIYLCSELPEAGGEMSRGQLLQLRIFLPEDAVADWFGTPPSFAIFDRWPVIGLAAAVLLVGWLAGRLLLHAIGLKRSSVMEGADSALHLTRTEHFLFACGAGLNVVSLYVLGLGLFGALNRWSVLLPAAGILAANAWSMARKRRSRCWPGADKPATEGDDGISLNWLWLAAPFALAILLGGMLPPIDFDVREYHLQAPKEFFQDGRISFLPHNVYGNMPLGSEMFCLLAMVLLDDWWLGALVGKTLIAAFAPLTALALLAAGRRFASLGAGVIAAVLYLSSPWITVVSTSGLIEGVLAFYLFLAFYAALLWRQLSNGGWPSQAVIQPRDGLGSPSSISQIGVPSQNRWWSDREASLALTGFCAGGAVSCKYPAVLFVAVPLLLFIAFFSGKRCWKPLAIFSMALVAGCGLWFAKNWALTGNPVYPLLYDWLDGATRTVEKNERWLRAHSPHDFSLSALADSLSAVAWKSSWLSPILAPLAALGLLVRRYRTLALVLASYFTYIIATWWLFTHRIDRFWLPALPLLSLLAGLGAVWSVSLAWRRMVLTLLVTAAAISFVYVTAPTTYNTYFVSLQTARHDSRRLSPWHALLNKNVPEGAKVLSVGDAQVFDLSVPVLYNTPFDDSPAAAVFERGGPREIAAELRRHDISHVYVDWNEIARYRQPGNYGGVSDVITPDWFAGLVEQGVLGMPWRHPLLPNQAVYPVP